ncbi:MAG: CBS domain-containing protein [Oscillospiraceae bacterium]|nr:CBS domain-containing protein [Oscillospiraceae bacterium]
MLVKDLMNSNVVNINPEENAALAARLLHRHNVGSLPVCALDGSLKGIVTDRDIVIRCVATDGDPGATKVRDIMTRGVVSVAPSSDVHEASKIMAEEQVRRLPVVEDGRVVGMLALGDVARTHNFDTESGHALCEISQNLKTMK